MTSGDLLSGCVAGLVCIEDLNTAGMTRSAKGTTHAPGRNVRAKAGLNREILKTGWGQLRAMLEYKARPSCRIRDPTRFAGAPCTATPPASTPTSLPS